MRKENTMWHVAWKERFSASILLIGLFALFLFFLVPRQPTRADVIFMLVGSIGGLLFSRYLTHSVPSTLNQPRTVQADGQRKGFIGGIILMALIVGASLWWGKPFIMRMALLVLPGGLMLGIAFALYHWRHRPHA